MLSSPCRELFLDCSVVGLNLTQGSLFRVVVGVVVYLRLATSLMLYVHNIIMHMGFKKLS